MKVFQTALVIAFYTTITLLADVGIVAIITFMLNCITFLLHRLFGSYALVCIHAFNAIVNGIMKIFVDFIFNVNSIMSIGESDLAIGTHLLIILLILTVVLYVHVGFEDQNIELKQLQKRFNTQSRNYALLMRRFRN